MAFDRTKLVCIAQGAVVGSTARRAQIYHYVTADAESVVAADSYFGAAGAGASDLLASGDMILASCVYGGTTAGVLVTINSALDAAVTSDENT